MNSLSMWFLSPKQMKRIWLLRWSNAFALQPTGELLNSSLTNLTMSRDMRLLRSSFLCFSTQELLSVWNRCRARALNASPTKVGLFCWLMRCNTVDAMITNARIGSLHLWMWSAAFLTLHAVSIVSVRSHAVLLSCFFLSVAPLCAAIAVWRQSRNCLQVMRRYWMLVGSALLLWSAASIMSAREEVLLTSPGNVGTGSQIVYFLYGVPLLLAICSPPENVWGSSLIWIDGLQISLLAFLAYLTIFSAVPFLHETARPLSGNLVVLTFNVENLVLVAVGMLRLLAVWGEPEKRAAYRTLFIFLCCYAGIAALYNQLTLGSAGPLGIYDLLIDLPFAYLACASFGSPTSVSSSRVKPHAKLIALTLENASPVLFPVAILAMSIVVAGNHFRVGLGCIAATLLLYAAKSSLLQIRFQQGQFEARRARDHMELLSLTDPLTGISNRRRFDNLLVAEHSRMSRQQHPLSLLLIDVDYFKLLNDRFGHSDGDTCLRQVAHALQSTLRRESDVLCRFGGEEFACLLPGTDSLGAEILARRMQSTIKSLRLRTETPLGNVVTVSIGVTTTLQYGETTHDQLVRAADRALYRAKQNGRDRIEFQTLVDQAPSGLFATEARDKEDPLDRSSFVQWPASL